MSSTDAFSAKQYIQDFRKQFQQQQIHGLSAGRFAPLVRLNQSHIRHQVSIKAQTAQYLFDSVGLDLADAQWNQIVDHFGKHLRWLCAATEKTDGVTPLDELPAVQRRQVIDRFFVDYVVRATNWSPYLNEYALSTLPVFEVEYVKPKPIEEPIDTNTEHPAVKPEIERYKHADVQGIVALNLGYTVADATQLIRRRAPFVRARRAAEEAARLMHENKNLNPSIAKKKALASKALDMEIIGDEALRDDPLVQEICILYTNIDAQTAAEWASYNRRQVHHQADLGRTQLGLSLEGPIDPYLQSDLKVDERLIANISRDIDQSLSA